MKTKQAKYSTIGMSIFLIIGLLVSCKNEKFTKTSIDSFVGTWELQGRSMFNGIKVKIDIDNTNNLSGKVVALNNAKYVKMFVENGDTWVTKIKRSSNYEFKLTEKKIASKLFSIYGQSTSKEFNVQFIDKNTLGLGAGNTDPLESVIIYKRIINE